MSELINLVPFAANWIFEHFTLVWLTLIAASLIYTIGFTRGARIR